MPPLDRSAPFVLLDDARASGAAPARLYRDPVDLVEARQASEVGAALERLRTATTRGLHAAGWLAYEAGLALDRATRSLAASSLAAPPAALVRAVRQLRGNRAGRRAGAAA